MTDMRSAVDISNYTGRLSPEQAGYLRDNTDLVIVRLSTETSRDQHAIALQQIEALNQAGVPWQSYLWCYWADSPYELWMRASEGVDPTWSGYYGGRIWLDLEDHPSDDSRAFDWILSYAALLEMDDFRPGIYTGQWWLDQHPGILEGQRAHYLTSFPLWIANYSHPGDCTIEAPAEWQRVAMHQYASREAWGPLGAVDLSVICEPDPYGL